MRRRGGGGDFYIPSAAAFIYYGLLLGLLAAILAIVILLFVNQNNQTYITTSPAPPPIVPNVACGGDIQGALDSLQDIILTSPCVYNISSSLILTSGKTLRAYPADKQTILKLANGADRAVILVGNDLQVGNSAPLVSNVLIKDITIDGNKAAQTSEFTPGKPWLRNNGIDVRFVKNLVIDNVYIHDARSGAIVVSWDSEDIVISSSLLTTSFFDGVALYTSTNIIVTDCILTNNVAAGISIDNNLRNTQFINCLVNNNGDVGVFQRWATNVSYDTCQISNNGNHGFFLSWNPPTAGTGVIDTLVKNCQISNNVGRGLNLDSPATESTGTLVSFSTLSGNLATPFSGPNGGTLPSCAQIVAFDGGGNPPTITLNTVTCS